MVGVGAIRIDQLIGLVAGRREKHVGLLGDLALQLDAQRWLWPRAARKAAVLDQPQRVSDVRPPGGQLRPQQARDLA